MADWIVAGHCRGFRCCFGRRILRRFEKSILVADMVKLRIVVKLNCKKLLKANEMDTESGCITIDSGVNSLASFTASACQPCRDIACQPFSLDICPDNMFDRAKWAVLRPP